MSLGELGLTDASVPGVALIGDGDRLWQILAETGERLIDRGYLRYKPGTSLVAGLRLASGHAFAYAVGAAAAAKPRKTVDRAPEGSVLCWSPANGLLIARAGADRDLPGLLRPDRLAAALPEGVRAARWETLAYKPQRRWVARPFESGRALPYVVRAYRRNDLPRAMAGWDLATEVAARGAGLVLPRILVRARRGGIATTSWLPGAPLDRLLAGGPVDTELLVRVGDQLARLHAGLPARPGDGVAGRLRAARAVLREVAAVLPDHRARAGELLLSLTARAPEARLVRPIHGDFSADQVIVGPDGSVGLTDWDRGGWGDPATDLGSLRAAGLPEDGYAAVLAGYTAVRDLPEAVDWHTAVTRLLRLTEPLRQCRVEWRTEIQARLAALEESVA